MAAITTSVGTLDVTSLVTQLVSAERGPQDARLNAVKSRINVTLSAIGTFKGGLSALQSAVEALKGSGSAIGKLSTSVSKDGYFTASASGAAVAGRYEVEVLSLAKAHKVASDPFVGGASSVVGDGTVTIDVGGDDFVVTLASPNNTLADLRNAINAAQDNTGVSATLLTEDGGTRLVLTSATAGTAHQISVTTTLFATAQAQPASNAQIKIDDFTHTGSSNTITGALDGVTLDLTKAEPGTKITLDVSADRAGAAAAIQEMVRAYNAVVGVVKKHGSYDATTKTGGPLMGDIGVRSAMQQIRSILGGEHGQGAYSLLSQLGIRTQTDGTLSVDAAKLDAALVKDPDAVRELFSGTDRVAEKLSKVLDGFLDSDGRITAQTDRLQKRLDLIADQTEALDRRMELMRVRYMKQFTALDTLLGQMQGTSNYLAQQLASLPGASSSS
jgi:flagellar hook-associated protein 2